MSKEEIQRLIDKHGKYIAEETLSTSITIDEASPNDPTVIWFDMGPKHGRLGVRLTKDQQWQQ